MALDLSVAEWHVEFLVLDTQLKTDVLNTSTEFSLSGLDLKPMASYLPFVKNRALKTRGLFGRCADLSGDAQLILFIFLF